MEDIIEKEEWKEIENTNYLISNFGRVKNKNRNKILKCYKDKNDRLYFKIKQQNKPITMSVAREVAKHFVPNIFNKKEVNHIDGNKCNNYYKNLEWVTREENIRHAYDNGLMTPSRGEKSGMSKLTWEDVTKIRQLYKPYSKQYSVRKLAKIFKVDHRTIQYITSNKTWKEEWRPTNKC